jgi:hypothetical protein
LRFSSWNLRMTRYSKSPSWAAFLAVGLLAGSAAKADIGPPAVTYTVTGSPDNWALDFTVHNYTNQSLYFFGVSLPAADITGSPSSHWCTTCYTRWSNAAFGGSNTSYNNVWIAQVFSAWEVDPGTSLGGFTALDTADVAAPTSIHWFAYTLNQGGEGDYTGGGNFYSTFVPGFEGSASPVPEPRSIGLLFAVIGGVGLAAGWRRPAAGSSAPEQ